MGFGGWMRGMFGMAAASPDGARPRPVAVDPAYRSASLSSQELAAYLPPLTSGDSATLHNARLTLDRAQDLARNDPVAVAAIGRLVDLLVGPGLNLSARPNARALGLTRQQARAIGQRIEAEWSLFWGDPLRRCDYRRRLTGNGIFRLGARTLVRGGEAAAVLRWRTSATWRYRMAVQPVDPDRIRNPQGAPDSLLLRGGVEHDGEGTPIAYHVTDAHPADWFAGPKTTTWTRIPRETAWGRPVFVHAYEQDREDQTRAISPFAALVARLRMITRHADTEIAAAAVNALFAAFISSQLSTADVAASMSPVASPQDSRELSRVKYYKHNPPTMGGVRIPVLPIGDKVEINGTPRQTTAFPAFQAAFLQSIAAALGLSYEQLSMDWSKTNFSSARAALNEVWRSISRLLAVFIDQYVTPIYFAFLEETIDRGYVAIPGGLDAFHAMPAAWMAGRWIGPGRGYVDPETEADAAIKRMGAMISTLSDEAADQGRDIEELLDQVEAEEEMLSARGLTRQTVTGTMPGQEPTSSAAPRAQRAAEGQADAAS